MAGIMVLQMSAQDSPPQLDRPPERKSAGGRVGRYEIRVEAVEEATGNVLPDWTAVSEQVQVSHLLLLVFFRIP